MQRTPAPRHGRDVRTISARLTTFYEGRIDGAQLELCDALVVISDLDPKNVPKSAPELPEGQRWIGAVNVFASRGLKPRNYMPCASVLIEDTDERLVVVYERGSRRERLEVYFHEKYIDQELPPAQMHGRLVKLGSEREVGDLLEQDIDALGEPGLKFLAREFRTSVGPIDFLCEDADGAVAVVELKRGPAPVSAETVYQTMRYIDALHAHPDFAGRTIRGIIAAPSISKEAQRLCAETGIQFRRVRYSDLLERRPR